ncbi:hypothetical protein GF323_03225 [Candidatus Woesearchaeota archaeon]|nr:hypothetical protein [Candidatus Woesearchaeota archaeon]
MKKALLVMPIILLLAGICMADLADFPENFMKGNRFNGYIVVGKGAGSMDVISQSTIAMKMSSYAGKMQPNINKLDSEASLQNNLILIGNPCVNDLTSELLGNPSPCNKDFPSGKAYIRYYEDEGVRYIVVAGYSNTATRKAAEYLSNFETNALEGDEVEISIETTEDRPEEEAKKKEKEAESSIVMPPPDKVAPLPEEINEESEEIILDAAGEEHTAEESKAETVVVEDANIFTKFWSWLRGLFGR